MAEENYSDRAIQSVMQGKMAFCKFLSANDTGLTNAHQCGMYIPKPAYRLLFSEPGQRGSNKERLVRIRWQGDFTTDSRFIYYGTGTRNEYRVTRFGHGFNLLDPQNTGALVVLVQQTPEDYEGWLLTTDDEIDAFLGCFGMSPADTGALMDSPVVEPEGKKKLEMEAFLRSLGEGFPKAEFMSAEARRIYGAVYDHQNNITKEPDKELIHWIDMEYELFRRIEEDRYGAQIQQGFVSMQDFVDVANSVLNRRKSRAGKSLEYHLAALFDGNGLRYEAQVVTEEKKRPDFVFPGGAAYHNPQYDISKLIVLGAKTTCKDRWRQIINEADRVKEKYLCTLQQGISPQQLHEMQSEHVILVVPKPYIKSYPPEYQDGIYSLSQFIAFAKEKTT